MLKELKDWLTQVSGDKDGGFVVDVHDGQSSGTYVVRDAETPAAAADAGKQLHAEAILPSMVQPADPQTAGVDKALASLREEVELAVNEIHAKFDAAVKALHERIDAQPAQEPPAQPGGETQQFRDAGSGQFMANPNPPGDQPGNG